jgi:3'-5' exoribonuclease
MKSIFIKDLKKGLILSDEIFLITSAEKAEDKFGKPYYKISLGDKTGRLDSKIWSDTLNKLDEKILKAGNLLRISGKVDEYKGAFQINIMSASKVEDESKLEEFLESSMYSADEMMKDLIRSIETIEDTNIKNILTKIINDDDVNRRLKYWPAANTVHHSFRSGLLQHISEMLEISKSLKRFYPEVNFDLLTAGIILHDIGKIYELDGSDLAVPYTKMGTLLGHIVISLKIFEDFGGKDLPEDTYLHIAHLILSHHGTQMYGSPVVPATVEAVMLTHIDNLSAKARTADSAKKEIPDGEEFSRRNIWLENAKIWNGGSSINVNDVVGQPNDNSKEKKVGEQLAFS